MPTFRIFVGNDTVLQAAGVRNGATGAYLNAATVQATITEWETGAAIANVTNPVTLSYVAASDGVYRAVLQQNAGFVVDRKVRVVLVVTESGLDGRWEFGVPPERRGLGD